MNPSITMLGNIVSNAGLLAFLLDAVIKSLILLGLAGAVCLAWRHGAASSRHLLWFMAVLGCMVVPILSGVLPASPRPLWTVRGQSGNGNELTLAIEVAPRPDRAISLDRKSEPQAGTGPVRNPTRQSSGQGMMARFRASWAAAALAVWLAGVAIVALWTTLAHLRLAGMARRSHRPGDPEWPECLESLCEKMGIGRRVLLLHSSEPVMPLTWGWWHPVVLLPAEAASWPGDRLRIVLLHELAHVKRWDCLTQLIGRVASAVYWFNPLVWVATRQMCIERERACDDLVLGAGCRASDYALHLVEIARAFRPVPRLAAIAMARPSQLHRRIEAIVDPLKRRGGPPAMRVIIAGIAALGLLSVVAAQQQEREHKDGSAQDKPWFDARLRAFFAVKAAQVRELAAGQSVPPEVWPYFEAGMKGDWEAATNLWVQMRARAHQYEGTRPDDRLNSCWSPILETDLAWEQFANWTEKYVLEYGDEIIKSIPRGSIYFGGTDPGRGVVTVMCKSQVQGDPFFILTQNALADATYLDYLRAMYGSKIYTPTHEDSEKAFQDYCADAERRLNEHKLKPGEDVRKENGKIVVSGQIAVMSINGLLTRVIFDHNTNREFYVEESFPLDWMYPHLEPHGPIMKLNREPLAALSETTVQQDHAYWSRHLERMLGTGFDDTPVPELARVVERVYVKRNLAGFKGHREFLRDSWAQKGYSKLRSSIGGVYQWRANNAKTPAERQWMTKEADFAFCQAYALCPTSPEALFRYVNLLVTSNRFDDAILLAETTEKLDPENIQIKSLLGSLRSFKKQKAAGTK